MGQSRIIRFSPVVRAQLLLKQRKKQRRKTWTVVHRPATDVRRQRQMLAFALARMAFERAKEEELGAGLKKV